MNDNELDEMLNKWDAPQAPRRLRGRIEAQLPRKRSFTWPSWHLNKGLLAGAAAGAAVCFIGIAAAFPQAIGPSVRFSLSSDFIEHKDDGSSVVYEYRESTAQNGREIILARANPESHLMSIHFLFFDTLHRLLGLGVDPTQPPVSMALSDCSIPAYSVIGHETVLNYGTIVQREVDSDGSRYTEWRSRDLDCIVMKYTKEELTNGQLKLKGERRPVLVKLNRAQ